VDAIESIVAQAARSERASVANAVVQDPPGVGKVIAVLPKTRAAFPDNDEASDIQGQRGGDRRFALVLNLTRGMVEYLVRNAEEWAKIGQ